MKGSSIRWKSFKGDHVFTSNKKKTVGSFYIYNWLPTVEPANQIFKDTYFKSPADRKRVLFVLFLPPLVSCAPDSSLGIASTEVKTSAGFIYHSFTVWRFLLPQMHFGAISHIFNDWTKTDHFLFITRLLSANFWLLS